MFLISCESNHGHLAGFQARARLKFLATLRAARKGLVTLHEVLESINSF